MICLSFVSAFLVAFPRTNRNVFSNDTTFDVGEHGEHHFYRLRPLQDLDQCLHWNKSWTLSSQLGFGHSNGCCHRTWAWRCMIDRSGACGCGVRWAVWGEIKIVWRWRIFQDKILSQIFSWKCNIFSSLLPCRCVWNIQCWTFVLERKAGMYVRVPSSNFYKMVLCLSYHLQWY